MILRRAWIRIGILGEIEVCAMECNGTVGNRRKMKTSSRNKKRYIQSYLMISTQLIGLFVFTLYPILWVAHKSFYYYTGASSETRFIGFDNFITLFTTDGFYWKTWVTTLKFTLMKLPIELTLAMIIALILHRGVKGKGFFRAMFYLPNIISVAIVGLIFTNMFDYFGLINAWLVKLGVVAEEIDWFRSANTAMWALVVGNVWSAFGINTLYFIAGLSNIPEDVYESAKIDGASKWTTFFKITLPLMAPVLQTVLLLAINSTLHVTDYILVTTNGAPGGNTFTVMAYLVSKFVPGFAQPSVNIGYGCALSLITSVIMGIIALIYTKISSKMQNLY